MAVISHVMSPTSTPMWDVFLREMPFAKFRILKEGKSERLVIYFHPFRIKLCQFFQAISICLLCAIGRVCFFSPFGVIKTTPKLSRWIIRIKLYTYRTHFQLKVTINKPCKAQENLSVQVEVGFWLASDWRKECCVFPYPVTECQHVSLCLKLDSGDSNCYLATKTTQLLTPLHRSSHFRSLTKIIQVQKRRRYHIVNIENKILSQKGNSCCFCPSLSSF